MLPANVCMERVPHFVSRRYVDAVTSEGVFDPFYPFIHLWLSPPFYPQHRNNLPVTRVVSGFVVLRICFTHTQRCVSIRNTQHFSGVKPSYATSRTNPKSAGFRHDLLLNSPQECRYARLRSAERSGSSQQCRSVSPLGNNGRRLRRLAESPANTMLSVHRIPHERVALPLGVTTRHRIPESPPVPRRLPAALHPEP